MGRGCMERLEWVEVVWSVWKLSGSIVGGLFEVV